MKFFSGIIHSALLITTPTMAVHPVGEGPSAVVQQSFQESVQVPDLRTLSYDEVVNLLALVESDSFEDTCSLDELNRLNEFVAMLAIEGATEDERVDVQNSIASLFGKDFVEYALLSEHGYVARPAIYIEGSYDIMLCRSWFKKKWDETRDFCKKHKKAIIIGAVVVVTVAVVVVTAVAISSSVASAGAAAGGALASGDSSSKDQRRDDSRSKEVPSNESFVSSLQNQVSSFKETIATEQFTALNESGGISIEENGRIVGSLFAHKAVDAVTANLAQNPSITNELRDLGIDSQYPFPKWLQTYPGSSTIMPHPSTDLAFSTNYATTYAASEYDVNMLSYQARGNLALSSGYYSQAIQDFSSAITIDPNNPSLYLERGIANFGSGNYEQSIADYTQYVERKAEPFSVTDFSIGFAKGTTKGAYESGKGTLLFFTDFITHPVQTSKQVVDSLTQLATLVKNDEFGVLAEVLAPELHQLVTQWDSLPSLTRGELAGYILGKLGADFATPGMAAKLASKGVSSAKELVAICKEIRIAQEMLVLETASGIRIPAKVAEIVEMGKKTAILGEELGFTAQEIGQLKQAGKLETAVSSAYENLAPSLRESYDLFKKAENFLEAHKGFMSEIQARELIHQAGIKTFPRPQGIPDNFKIKISDTGAGMKYVHPIDEGTYVRIMPGKPHSPNPYQQKPYVCRLKNGKCLDKNGNMVNRKDPAAHIPLDEFVYGD